METTPATAAAEDKLIGGKQVACPKKASRNSYNPYASEIGVASLQNLQDLKAGNGMDDLEVFRESQICGAHQQQLNRKRNLENEKTENSLSREILDQRQHWLSNQLEMIAADSRPAVTITRNNDNDHSSEAGNRSERLQDWRRENEGVACLEETRGEEACREITTSPSPSPMIKPETKMMITTTNTTSKQQTEWNLMQIVESAESKLMRQRQARDEEAGVLRNEEAKQQSSRQGSGDIIQIQNVHQTNNELKSKAKNYVDNSSSKVVSETTLRALNTSFPRKFSRSSLMLKSPAFATITLEKGSGDEEEGETEKPFICEPPKENRSRAVVVSDCGRKFEATSCKVGASSSLADSNLESLSGSSGYVTAGNMTNRVENKAPSSRCSQWNGQEQSTSLKCATSNLVVGGENLSQEPKSSSIFVSSAATSTVCSNTETPTSSYIPQPLSLLRNSPQNFLSGRDEETKQKQSLTTSTSTAATATATTTTKDHGRLNNNILGDCEEDDREGPTPTNDLIRTLIQRDKVALSGKRYNQRESQQQHQQHQQQQQQRQESSQMVGANNLAEHRPVAIDSSPSSWSASSPSSSSNRSKTGSPSPFSSSPSLSYPNSNSPPHSQKRRHKLERQQPKQHHSLATIGLGQRQRIVNTGQEIEQVSVIARPNRRKRKRTKQQMRATKTPTKSKPSSAHFQQQQLAKEVVLDSPTKTFQNQTTAKTMRKSVIRTETVEPNLTSSVDCYDDYSTNKRIGFSQTKSSNYNNIINNNSSSNCNNSELEISQIDTTVTTAPTTSSASSDANTRQQQIATKMLDTHNRDKQRPNWDSFAASALELSAQLISKCHLVASGHSDGGGGVTASNRKPSDASLNREYNNTESIDNKTIQQLRRHSTYMLPMLLNKDPNDNTLSSSSSSSSASLSEQTSETGIYNTESLSDLLAEEELARVLSREPESGLMPSSRNLINKELTSHLPARPSSYLSQNSKLTTSASSPSALSTPTNDKAGCGGPCCRQPRETELWGQKHLMGVARGSLSGRSNIATSVANEQSNVMKRIRKLSLFSGNQYTLTPSNTDLDSKAKVRTKNCELKRQQQQQQQQQPRRRTGSNPLERLRLTTNHLTSSGEHNTERNSSIIKLSSPRARIQSIGATNELAKSSIKSGKRHSIINLLAGNGGGNNNNNNNNTTNVRNSDLFSSKLNSRSIFSTSLHRDGIKNNNYTEGSLEGSMNKTGITSLSWMENHLPFTNSSSKLHLIEQQQQQQQDQHCEPLIPESGFKIVVMGTSGSGKTSIIQRFMYNSFNWRHLPTIEDTYFIEFPYKKNLINISISDTSGTYQFPAMKRLAINSGDAFILVYSVDNPDSFEELEQLRQTILNEREQAYLDASASLASSSNPVSLSQSSGLASTSNGCSSQSQSSVLSGQQTNNYNNNKLLRDGGKDDVSAQIAPSPSRHWSLGSLFHHQHNNNSNSNNNNNNYSHNTSLSSSICSSTCSSTDTSRRSSVSAAEAALRTRRTRRPPMVIVANKYDLPHDQHLVNSDEIEAMAVIDWNNGYVRASAALNLNIDEIFQQVLKQARQPPTLAEAILSKRRKSLPPKLPH